MTTDRERFERGRRFLKAVSSNFANDSDDQEGKEWRDAAFFLQRAALAQPVAPGEPTYQDGVKDGLTRAAPDYKALAVAASLEAVLPLLRTIQGMGIPGDHDEIIARAAHNLAVYRKCAEAQPVAAAGDEWRPIDMVKDHKGMFIWARPKSNGEWGVGLGYKTVSGGWADAYGASTEGVTIWHPMPETPNPTRIRVAALRAAQPDEALLSWVIDEFGLPLDAQELKKAFLAAEAARGE